MKKEIDHIKSVKKPLFSILKGIGITLVVTGHSGCPDFIRNFIYSFHMPLFFIISGYLFKETYFQEKNKFIQRRIFSLYVPFVIWSIVFILLHNVFYHFNLINDSFSSYGTVNHIYTIKETLIRISKSFLLINSESFLGAFWFLKALFCGSILFILIQSKIKNVFFIPLTCIIIILLRTFLISKELITASGETLHQAIYALLFISIGHILKQQNIILSKFKISIYLLILTIISQFKSLSMNQDFLNCLIIPFSGSLGFIILFNMCHSLKMGKNIFFKITAQLGDYSLYILVFHFLMFKPISFLKIKLYDEPTFLLGEFPIISIDNSFFWIIYTTFSLVTSFVFGLLIRKGLQIIKAH
ncbi:Fucose 4-O-acetylase [Fibrobacter sp. UWH9]|uniref:acyltransferase family protein n=1 Tax=Fibrobacter sp. UWH9 TaxID=1896213 RepID=UPI000919AB1E|nr:acyltransferase family protein [Fibrobacter sp. UWH9]SHH27566.1 Fucose 4-O-acetylase [Fibrobacter sp. UWH9]